MPNEQPTGSAPPRFTVRAAMDRFNALLNLNEDEGMQDWEIELADPERVAEFCTLYETPKFDPDTRFALMQLIVASLDDCLSMHPTADAPDLEQRVERLLRAEFLLHLHTVNDWQCIENDLDDAFCVAPMMRRIWQECFREEYGQWLDEVVYGCRPESDAPVDPSAS